MIFKKCPNCDMENPETEIYCLDCGTRLDPEKTAALPGCELPEDQAQAPSQPEAPSSPPVEEAPPEPEPVAPPEEAAKLEPEPPTPPVEAAPPKPEPAAPPEEEAPPEPEPPAPPFGERYKVLEVIGTGPTGTVYKVFDKALDRELALKAIGPEFAERPEAFEGFSRELRVERGIVHKNIARLFELNVEKGRPFITMEFVSGQTLEALIKEKRGPLPVDQAVGLAGQLTKGVAELHQRGVTRLNLRPRNIMVDKEGTPRIMELGLSRWLTSKGFAEAKPDSRSAQYVSPEEAEGRIVDFRSDIYSLGIIIYEMVTGIVPSAPETPDGAPGGGLKEAPRNPHDLNPRVPTGLGLIILRCLARDRDLRYQSANDLGSDLERLQSGPEPEAVPSPLETLRERPAGPPTIASETPGRRAPALKRIIETGARKMRSRGLPSVPAGTVRIILIALAVIVAAAVVWRLISRPGRRAAVETAPDKITVTVLPFAETGTAKNREYFGEGLAEALVDGLNRLPGFSLTSAASSLPLSEMKADSAQIGRTLGAGFVLTGTFEPGDNSLLITVRLVKAADGSQVWESRFDRSPEDVFGVLKDIARGLVQALGISAPADGVNALFNARPVLPEACDLYFRGRSFAGRGGKGNLEKSVELFQQAAAKDPEWAAVHAGLANAYVNLGSASLWPPDKAFPSARKAILKALELEPGLAEARLALAILKWRSEWNFAAAEQEFREVLRTLPEKTEIRRSFALFLSSLGRHEEAQSEIRTAQALEPLSPRIGAGLGMVLYFARLYDLAAVELTKARDASPADFEPCLGLGLLHIQTGDFEESIRMFQKAAALGGDPREMSLRIGVVLARLGMRQDVGKILSEAIQASRQTYVSYASLAAVYAGLMEPDQAHACLEKALAERDASLVFLKVSPLFDPVRSRPWFAGLLEKTGF